MGFIEKTIFISYRRTNVTWALAIYQNLTHHGYDVFFDYFSIPSGSFEKTILENIKRRAHFLVILTPSALERCNEPGDWLRREIETAMDERRNIVPLMLEGFDFGSPLVRQALTGKLASLPAYNGLRVYAEYFLEGMNRLREQFLNVEVSEVSLPELTVEVREITAAEKSRASAEPPVEKEQLTAQQWFERGYVFHTEANNPDEAIRCYREAIRLDPSLGAAYNNLGGVLRDLKRYEEAEAACRKAIELDPAYAAAYYNLGVLSGDLKRYEEAEAAYRKAIQLDPASATAYNNLGNVLRNLERDEEAEAAYRKAVELDPASAIAYNNLGNVLCNLERDEEAEAAYRKAIQLDPAYATARYNLGILLDDLKRYEEAEAACRKAIQLDPADATAYNSLGNVLRNLERYEEAEAAYRKAIELDPADAAARYNLGVLLRLRDRLEEALAVYIQLMEIKPDDFDTYMAVISTQKHMGRDISEQDIEQVRQLMPEDDWYNRACLESIGDNVDLAFEYLRRAADNGRFNPKWTWQDPDLQWIRNDPRFEEIVGPQPE